MPTTTRRPTHRRPGRDRDDTGAITLFVVVLAVALLVVIGLVVDGAGKVRAIQRADRAAQEAARTAGQQLQIPTAVRGDTPALDTAAAARAARAYLATVPGVTGTVTVNGNTITVRTTTTYEPVFVSLIGVGTMTVTGNATARPVRGVTQEVP